jgi:DNA modification methylase
MDNKSGEIAEWDIDYLGEEVHDLIDLEYDTDMTGFSETELLDLGIFEDEEDLGNTDEDDAPDMPEEPTARLGDLWTMGDHRLLCGDSTSMTDLDRLMDGVKADMVFTDPPYNANYKSRGSNNLLRQGIQNDAMSNDAFEIFIQGFLATLYASTKAGASYYICCNWKDSYPRFYRNMTESGVNVSSCIVWNKGSGGMGWQDYRYQYEFIIYAFKQDQGHIWYGGRAETDIWTMNREARGTYIHPTQKPVELIRRALKNSSKSEDVVLDLFGGSGSTLIGCQKMKRSARLMELDPRYCDVIIQRWEQFTGQTAVLER